LTADIHFQLPSYGDPRDQVFIACPPTFRAPPAAGAVPAVIGPGILARFKLACPPGPRGPLR